jgi:dimethylargininase
MPTTTSSGPVADRPLAIVRGVPDSFTDAVTGVQPDPPLSYELARDQHTAYVAALRAGGYEVARLDADEDHPDCLFVEDTAVVVGEHALITRLGHESRRGEVDPVADVLGRHVRLHRVQAPATIDGGDVLIAGTRVFVGLSIRTNVQGVKALAAISEPQGFSVMPVEVGSVLHLKSGVSAVDDRTVLWHHRACDREALTGLRIVEVPGDDPEAANVVRLADGRILVGAHHPGTVEIVEGLGFEVVPVDVREIARADGGLTCMSIRLR